MAGPGLCDMQGLELKCTEENFIAILCYVRHVMDIITVNMAYP